MRARGWTALASAACALVMSAPARGGETPPGRTDLDALRSAVEDGIVGFAIEPLRKLHAEPSGADRDEVALLLSRCLFALGEYDRAARVLEGYEGRFPADSRFVLDAALWLARADLERARRADTAEGRARLLARARLGFTRVLEESLEARLIEGARLHLGVTLFEEGEHERALVVLEKARELGVAASETEKLELYIGRTHLDLWAFETAARVFTGFVRRFPQSAELAGALYGLGEAHYYLEEWPEAAAAYLRSRDEAAARGDAATEARARYARGWALTKLGEKRSLGGEREAALAAWTEALAELGSRSLADHPDRAVRNASAFEAGELLYRLGRPAEAAERLLRLTDPARYPDYAAKALYVLGRCRAGLGQTPEAVGALEGALEAGATGDLARRVRYALAETLAESGDADGARRTLELLARTNESLSVKAEARFEIALLTRRAARLAEARGAGDAAAAHYATAHDMLGAIARDQKVLAELSADQVAYWRGRSAGERGRLEEGEGRRRWFEEALESYRAVRRLAGWNTWAERSLADEAELHVDLGDLDLAARACRELLDHEDVTPAVELATRLRLADIELELGRPAEARRALGPVVSDEALAAGRDEADFKTALARSREEGGLEDALRGFSDLLRRVPTGRWAPHAHVGLGDCLSALDRHAEAASEYEVVLLDFPSYQDRDRVELEAGNSCRAAGDGAAAVAHYRSLFRRGRSDDLRARALLGQAAILRDAGSLNTALVLTGDAEDTAGNARIVNEAREFRGELLQSLDRHEEAAAAFASAGEGEEGEFLARVKSKEAGALLAWARSGDAPTPANVLRRSARTYTRAHYVSADAALKDAAAFRAVEALAELAAAEEARGRAETAARELREARRLLDLVSDANAERRRARVGEIERLLKRFGASR